MLDFQIPRITSESVEQNRGTFTIEPLDRGFGYTFGNSLRRVLLSSLAGAAVNSVGNGALRNCSSVGVFCAFAAGQIINAANITIGAMRFINSLHSSQDFAFQFLFLKSQSAG